MKKIILIILSIISLCCPKVYANSIVTPKLVLPQQTTSPKIDDLYTKFIDPRLSTIEQVYFLYNNENLYGIAKLNFGNHAMFYAGFSESFNDVIEFFAIIGVLAPWSEKEKNCLRRPLEMFNDEIFDRYKKGEISKDDEYRAMFFAEMLNCSDKTKLYAKAIRLLYK